MTPGAEVFVRRFPCLLRRFRGGIGCVYGRSWGPGHGGGPTPSSTTTAGSSSWWMTTWRCAPTASTPRTPLRARAYDLKEWLTFLRLLDIAPLAAVPEHVDQFAGWLR